MLKRIFLIVLSALTVFASAIPALAAEEGRIKTWDIVCFGEPDPESGFDGRWLVLDAEHTNTGDEGMFLLSLSLVGTPEGGPVIFRDIGDVSVSFSDTGKEFAAAHPGVTDYQGSDIQAFCADFAERYFTVSEREAMLPTFKSDDAIVIPGFSIPLPGAENGTVDFDPAENVLTGDTVFIPSVEEITTLIPDADSRIGFYKGEAASYWLRSPHIPTFPLDVGFVFYFGAVMDYPVNGKSSFELDAYARPALNLSKSNITACESIADGIWRLSLGEANGRTYSAAAPLKGEAMDLGAILRTAVAVVAVVLVGIIILIAALIIRKAKRKK